MTTAALVAIVALAFSVEGALGFGATIVAVTLGAFLVPIDALLPAFVPLNMILSASIVARAVRAVDVRLLFFRVLPLMALGLPAGMAAARLLDGAVLVRVFGAFVVALAALELKKGSTAQGPLRAGPLLLLLGGVVHGMFGTGGPMAVYVAGRSLPDKAAFRATLSALWLLLNVVLVGGFVADGRVGADTVALSAWLAGGLVIGMVLGEVLHRRVPMASFRLVVWTALAVAGLALVVR